MHKIHSKMLKNAKENYNEKSATFIGLGLGFVL